MAQRGTKTQMIQTHHDLPKVTEKEIREEGVRVIRESDRGVQTAVVSTDGKRVLAVVGLNGCRYLPNPDPDPMDEIMLLALEAARKEHK
jgi:hypothetical protein